jgi:hypothetical protein
MFVQPLCVGSLFLGAHRRDLLQIFEESFKLGVQVVASHSERYIFLCKFVFFFLLKLHVRNILGSFHTVFFLSSSISLIFL